MEQQHAGPAADREHRELPGRFYDEPPPLNVSLYIWLLCLGSQVLYEAELLGKGKN